MSLIKEVARLREQEAGMIRAENWDDIDYEVLSGKAFELLPDILDALSLIQPGDASNLAFVLSGEWQPGTCHCKSCEDTTATVRRMLKLCGKMEAEP